MDQTWNHMATSWVIGMYFHSKGKTPLARKLYFYDIFSGPGTFTFYLHLHMDSRTDIYSLIKFWKLSFDQEVVRR